MLEKEIEPVRRTNSGRVIVFKPLADTLTTENAEDYKGELRLDLQAMKHNNSQQIADQPAIVKTAPKLGSRVEIREGSRLLATINLSKLGWTTNIRRLFGRCNEILVIHGA